ncbi:endonuclease/exonuclease/phosphatase family protein [Streptomyces sp. NBC_01264]|uniref:endonuclease/exonuclease/phosphatase family protein n=1 Tax=Streptomyces sp. NBC_01264 TaxID=2903804 RepID=UPI00225B5E1E|nr:endonuclease/exonuclease/phosphatase family protein [Streptomyces sp. NBC_01264]MCX4783626.1 endonuclease/exonuclease/phosphatase family protein [Streptomyces sp. NBC_01264]
MRLATFNILHGRPVSAGQPVWPGVSARGLLADAVESLGVDVLVLQEVDRFQERSGRVDQAAAAAAGMGAGDWRYASALHGVPVPGRGWALDPEVPGLRVYGPGDAAARGGGSSHGLALLCRLPVRRWYARQLAPVSVRMPLRVAGRPGLAWAQDRPRAALAAVVEGEYGLFTVVAVHLSFVPGWNAVQLAGIRRWVSVLPGPHIVAGDFNMVGPLPRLVLAATTRMDHPTRRGTSGCSAWRDLGGEPTYPSHRPRVRFDRILTAGISSGAVRGMSSPSMPFSDHKPLVTELAW